MEYIRPSADLRNHYADIARSCKETREPVYITVNGREDTVIMGSVAFRQMQDELTLLRALADAEDDVVHGRVAPVKDTFSEIRTMLNGMKERGEIK